MFVSVSEDSVLEIIGNETQSVLLLYTIYGFRHAAITFNTVNTNFAFHGRITQTLLPKKERKTAKVEQDPQTTFLPHQVN